MAVTIHMGACEICSQAAEPGAGHKSCEACHKPFEKLCRSCSSRSCPICSGTLVSTDTIFPHSLFRAIKDGESERVRRLLSENKINLNSIMDKEKETPLSHAVQIEDKSEAAKICQILLDCGMQPDAATGTSGDTALMTMVRYRVFKKEVAYLLQGSINARNKHGQTALMFAAEGQGLFGQRTGNLSYARNLLALGADLWARDNQDWTALAYAIRSNDTGKNESMIDFLKGEMIKDQALRRFKEGYSHQFDAQGQMSIAAKKMTVPASKAQVHQDSRSRSRSARSDGTVGALRSKIETTFGLPCGSVTLVNSEGRKLRSDATIGTLRMSWGED